MFAARFHINAILHRDCCLNSGEPCLNDTGTRVWLIANGFCHILQHSDTTLPPANDITLETGSYCVFKDTLPFFHSQKRNGLERNKFQSDKRSRDEDQIALYYGPNEGQKGA
jgi:hypothetical protein